MKWVDMQNSKTEQLPVGSERVLGAAGAVGVGLVSRGYKAVKSSHFLFSPRSSWLCKR